MFLNMYIGDELVESVQLNSEMISKPGYVGNFKRRLQNKYREYYLREPKPEFLVLTELASIRPTHKTIEG